MGSFLFLPSIDKVLDFEVPLCSGERLFPSLVPSVITKGDSVITKGDKQLGNSTNKSPPAVNSQ